MKTTGQIIKELRKQKGLTQEELGEILGVQKSAIAKYENDHVVNLKRETIEKMAEYFGVRPSYIMGMTSQEEDVRSPYFATPEEAVQWLLDLPVLAAWGGANVDEMTPEQQLRFAKKVVKMIKALSEDEE